MTNTQETTTPGLRKAQHAKRAFLDEINAYNNEGEYPSKAVLTRGVSRKTRASQYTMIGELIDLGLVKNVSQVGNTYALEVTPAGIATIDYWASV